MADMNASINQFDAEQSGFLQVYDTIKDSIFRDLDGFDVHPAVRAWLQRMVEHTVPGGKMLRGLMVAVAYEQIKGGPLSEEERRRAHALGWCIEVLQACFLVADDVMDNSLTRRGKPCWYRVVGLSAVNDAFILETFVYRILEHFFAGDPAYMALFHLFHTTVYRTELGQLCDLVMTEHQCNDSESGPADGGGSAGGIARPVAAARTDSDVASRAQVAQAHMPAQATQDQSSTGSTAHGNSSDNSKGAGSGGGGAAAAGVRGGVLDSARFNADHYLKMIRLKTAYYSFYLPVAAGMHLAGVSDTAAFETAESILVAMGEYFQIQDDFLDVFGDYSVMGKKGTDIEDGKVTWCMCQAVTRASADQLAVLATHFGHTEPASVARVKALMEELSIPDVYASQEKEQYVHITELIEAQDILPKELFLLFLGKIHKRAK